jgi:hypothetical protein
MADRYDKPICHTGPPGYIGWWNRFLDSLNVYKYGLRASKMHIFSGCPLHRAKHWMKRMHCKNTLNNAARNYILYDCRMNAASCVCLCVQKMCKITAWRGYIRITFYTEGTHAGRDQRCAQLPLSRTAKQNRVQKKAETLEVLQWGLLTQIREKTISIPHTSLKTHNPTRVNLLHFSHSNSSCP